MPVFLNVMQTIRPNEELIWTSELIFGLTFQNAFIIIREMIALMIAQGFYGIYFHCEI